MLGVISELTAEGRDVSTGCYFIAIIIVRGCCNYLGMAGIISNLILINYCCWVKVVEEVIVICNDNQVVYSDRMETGSGHNDCSDGHHCIQQPNSSQKQPYLAGPTTYFITLDNSSFNLI